ncbi:N-acyl-phosphatidylethanolamine-hydrolyzing phospholipase D [Pelomyxa schiedti]|nr:N-acyl-phosphatidylethanolamine-hydrolyzing phospholipase D [Pelomyxa schiedti]
MDDVRHHPTDPMTSSSPTTTTSLSSSSSSCAAPPTTTTTTTATTSTSSSALSVGEAETAIATATGTGCSSAAVASALTSSGSGIGVVVVPHLVSSVRKSMPVEIKTALHTTYANPWDTWTGLIDREKIMGWMFKPPVKPTEAQLDAVLPVKPVTAAELTAHDFTVCWIGHSTVFLRIFGVNILTDPLFAQRLGLDIIGEYKIGRKRARQPPISLNNLPKIDIVLISHNHQDHLDSGNVSTLAGLFNPLFLVPRGLTSWFMSLRITNVLEFNWWNSYYHSGTPLKITFVPAQHWSGRALVDYNLALWGGWVLSSNTHPAKVYYAGDTGYCPVFPEIASLGPFDLSLIPIGPNEPRVSMKTQHVGFEDAIKIHEEVNSRQSVGVHWGTWSMGADSLTQVKAQFAAECGRKGVTNFTTLDIGQVWHFYT